MCLLTKTKALMRKTISLCMDNQKVHPLIQFIKKTIPEIALNKDSLELILSQFEEYNLSKNEFLFKEGRIGNYYFLLDGYLRSYIYDNEGNEITTNFFKGERIIFEPASFFQNKPSTETIQAISECKGYVSTFDKLNLLFHSTPEFREFARAIIVKEFVQYKQESISKINKSAEKRYFELLETNLDLFKVAQLKHIASFLGMTDTSLSRIRNQVSKK